MNLWNVKDLSLPPINTYRCSTRDVDLQYLYSICQELKTFLNNKYMHAEFLVLSRIIYRMKQKFRSAKDLESLEKVNKALDIFFTVDIERDVTTFMELIPSRYEGDTYLPTKNMLYYLLVRFQGLSKLMERIVETCKISAFLLEMRMKTGHFWRVAFISFALVSRVYILAKFNTNQICEFYGKLLPFSGKLQNLGKNWLPQEYILPNDLKEWMNVSWLDFDDEVQIIEIPDIIEFFELVEKDDDVEFCNEYVMIDDKEVDNSFKKLHKGVRNIKSLKEVPGFNCGEDIGEVIEVIDPEVVDKHYDISNNECDFVYLSDNSVEFVDKRKEMTNSDQLEVILIPSISSETKVLPKLKKQRNIKKNKRNSPSENLIHFKTDINNSPSLKKVREYNVGNKLFSDKIKTVQTSSEQENNIEVKKRKNKKIFKNKSGKRIKLDYQPSNTGNNNFQKLCTSKPVDVEDSINLCRTDEKEVTSKVFEENDDSNKALKVKTKMNFPSQKVKTKKKLKKLKQFKVKNFIKM